ncbi:hypothetical protein L3X38_016544 [Prunus dulcis]|uniref:Uncharacterized protein n=1 Tax=Prunus dulcis TaxID=3755 RepID=A0AAD4W6H2_PRUDU|nr:hypothetical protein L3X38_016544 [Prunus dulcis]
MREAARWRKLQGICMEGDDELLADMMDVKVAPKRDEWMTTLPSERKNGMPPRRSTRFNSSNEAAAFASDAEEEKRKVSDRDLRAKLDSENMNQALTSRFSSGSYERNFL